MALLTLYSSLYTLHSILPAPPYPAVGRVFYRMPLWLRPALAQAPSPRWSRPHRSPRPVRSGRARSAFARQGQVHPQQVHHIHRRGAVVAGAQPKLALAIGAPALDPAIRQQGAGVVLAGGDGGYPAG